MAEYIFNIDEALYDEMTGQMAMKPKVVGRLIRCSDCEHWDRTWTNDFAPNYHYCPMVDGTRKDDFYCADAEEREDGQN
jgi:hypothetical protein